MTHLHLYTQGHVGRNPARAGWAFIAVVDGEIIAEYCGSLNNATSHATKLQSVIKALQYAYAEPTHVPKPLTDITIHTNSEDVYFGVRELEQRKRNGFMDVRQVELWQIIDKLITDITEKTSVTLHWAQMYRDFRLNPLFQRVDALAFRGRDNPNAQVNVMKHDAAVVDVHISGTLGEKLIKQAQAAGTTPDALATNIIHAALRDTSSV